MQPFKKVNSQKGFSRPDCRVMDAWHYSHTKKGIAHKVTFKVHLALHKRGKVMVLQQMERLLPYFCFNE